MNNKGNNRERNAYDSRFKDIIRNSTVLSKIIKDNVDGMGDLTLDEIKSCLDIEEDGKTVKGRNTEFGSMDNGEIRVDSLFDVRLPDGNGHIDLIVNVEAQWRSNPGYSLAKRAEYYIGRLVSEQKNTYFSNDDYDGLRKVYCIWMILNPNRRDWNKVIRGRMVTEVINGTPDMNDPVFDTYNITFINVGPYDDTQPDMVSFPSTMFNRMDDNDRIHLLDTRFNIELDDSIIEELGNVKTLDEEIYECGSIDKENEFIDFYVEEILKEVSEGATIEKALSNSMIRPDVKDRVESEVRKRLSR